MTAPALDRRRSGEGRRRGLLPRPSVVLGWLGLATLVALAELAEGPHAADADDTLPVLHAPVVVTPEWRHPGVRVVAERPAPAPLAAAARPREAAKDPIRALPQPFAALRLAANPLIMPRLALPRALHPSFPVLRSLLTRAKPGQPVEVMLSAYCLRGTTRRGTPVRPGIIAADPRVFPLAHHVELYAAGRYLGRYKVEDTGAKIRGTRIDIWTPDCGDAIRFGMRRGVAALVARGK